MGQITKLRKFNAAAVLLLASSFAVAQTGPRMPNITNVGVIPVVWQGADPAATGMHNLRVFIDDHFPKIVRESYRFRPLNDNLIRTLWPTPNGRAELVRDYELHAFVNMVATVSGDTMRLQVRILGPAMQIYLMEEDVFNSVFARGASRTQVESRLRRLIFRLFNRLPIDVSVISVQGRFVTLSGGRQQGLRIGDQLDVFRPSVERVHPADGSWVSYRSAVQGKLVVVDINEQTAIGKLTEQTYEDAVAVGDGVKIYNIPGRVMFARLADEQLPVDHGNPTGILSQPHPRKQREGMREQHRRPTPLEKNHGESQENKPHQAEPYKKKEPQEEQHEELQEEPQQDTFDADMMHIASEKLNPYRGAILSAGLDTWGVSGGAKSSATMAPWLLNYFHGIVRMPFTTNLDLESGGSLLLGTTKNGTYTGFDFKAKLLYLMPTDGIISYYRFGGLTHFQSRNIRAETFGGGDYLLLGGSAGLEGRVRYVEVPLEWFVEAELVPIGIGQVGYEGSKSSLKGAFGFNFAFGVIRPLSGALDWGGGLEFNTLGLNAGDSFSYSGTRLLVHARYRY